MKIHLSLFLVFCTYCLSISSFAAPVPEKTLQGGWYLWDPYQFLDKGDGYTQLNGLDINLQKAIAAHVGVKINFDYIGWKNHLKDLEEGKRAIGAGATKTPEREKFAYFSDPYRIESNSLFTIKNSKKKIIFDTADAFLAKVKQEKYRLGVVAGFVYVDPQINLFIQDPANQALIFPAENNYENLDNLFEDKIDGFLADRIAGATAAWRSNKREKIEEQILGTVPIHLIFSKKAVSPETVELFNQAIEKIKSTGEYDTIIRSYLFPILLMQTIDRNWFLIIDIIGTVAFALSGLIIAYRERASLFKAIVLAALPAIGGGVIRDLISNRNPIGIFKTPIYMIAIFLTVFIFYFLIQAWYYFGKNFNFSKIHFNKLSSRMLTMGIEIFDALGLAAFTVIGVTIAFTTKSDPLWLWGPVFAVLTGVGGGIIRDLFREDKIISAFRGEFYAEIPLICGSFLTSFILLDRYASPDKVFLVVLGTLISGFLLRMMVIILKFKLPAFRSPYDQNSSLSLEESKIWKSEDPSSGMV